MHALTLLAAFLLAVIATARLARLVVHDAYPPMEALRIRWEVYQGNRDAASRHRPGTLAAVRHGWGPLLTCPFCCTPYLAAVVLGVAMLAGVWSPGWSWASVWWTGAVWASVSYLAAMLVVRDEPED